MWRTSGGASSTREGNNGRVGSSGLAHRSSLHGTNDASMAVNEAVKRMHAIDMDNAN
jgi:hypothetical protein